MSDPLRRCGNADMFRLFIGCMTWIICLSCLTVIAAWALQQP